MKRFKRRKKHKTYILYILIIIIIFTYTFIKAFNYLYSKIHIDNTKYINYLINDSLGNYNIKDLTTLNSTQFLIKYSLGININNIPSKKEEKEVVKVIETNSKPIVYIYNTHQTEGYKTNFIEEFNINNTVLIASYILKEYLKDLGINSIVEEGSIANILNSNNWKYGSSYKASRILLNKAKENNPSLKYFFDIHRDSSSYENTVTNIDNKNYARLMFVVGLENANYEKNLINTQHLESLINNYNTNLSRGIMKKQGKGVNGLYNQDFDEQTFLIEVGGQYNSIDEINNTLKILARKIYEYIMENNYE